MQKSPKTAQDFTTHTVCISKDNKVLQLFCGNNGNIQIFVEIANENHHFIASMYQYFLLLSVKAMEANSGSDEAIKH